MDSYYKDMCSSKGYVLIFTIFLLFSIGLSLVAAKPYLFFVTVLDREEQTRHEIDRIVTAIKGDPRTRTFGYLSDMGRLPSELWKLNSQSKLNEDPQISFHWMDTFFQVGMGWKGPYVVEPVKDSYLKDAWNNDYVWRIQTVTVEYDPTDSTRKASWRKAQIISMGPDQVIDTSDDIKSEEIWESGALYVRIQQGSSNDIPNDAKMVMYLSDNGEQDHIDLGGGQAIVFSPGPGESTYEVAAFSNLHHGFHAFDLTMPGVTNKEQGIINVNGGVLSIRTVEAPPPPGPPSKNKK